MDDHKKPGQPRDISDLKARLGLKKTAAMPAASPAAGQQAAPAPIPSAGSGPTAAPPSPFAQPAAPPSPFGQPAAPPSPFAQPAPQPPPDPRRDPFAQQQAANLAAFYGIGQVLPGSSDAIGSEPITKPKAWGRIGLVLGLCAIVFGVGNACGRIYTSRVEFNRTIDQAGDIRDEVDQLGKQLNTVNDTIAQSKVTLTGGIDLDLTQKLGELDLKKPDTTRIFHTNYEHLEDVAIERLFTYYDHTIKLYDLISQHAKKTTADKDAITNFMKSGGAAKAEKTYGVIFDTSQVIATAQFVEVGSPVCPKPGQVDCTMKELKGFKYRTDSGGNWSQRPVKGKLGEIVVPIHTTPFFAQVVAGSPDVLAARDYLRRMAEIRTLAAALQAEQKDVLADLKRAAERPKVFVF